MSTKEGNKHFWKIRSAKYDKLFWVKDDSYIVDIIKHADLDSDHIVLDVGSGTGAMAKAAKQLVKHIVAVDTSEDMMSNGKWDGVSVINWDIGKALFKDAIFDRVIARMVFHHILDGLDRAVLRCYDLLKPIGKIVVAEGVPPLDDREVVGWYKEMFKYKEERITFTPQELKYALVKNGFRNVKVYEHIMENFNINNWLDNSGIDSRNRQKIIDIHLNAPQKIKDAYNMRNKNGEVLVKTKNVIVVGEK